MIPFFSRLKTMPLLASDSHRALVSSTGTPLLAAISSTGVGVNIIPTATLTSSGVKRILRIWSSFFDAGAPARCLSSI